VGTIDHFAEAELKRIRDEYIEKYLPKKGEE